MNFEPHTIVILVGAIAGVGGTWATLNHRLRAVEELSKAAREELTALAKTVEFVRTDQGRRLGVVEGDTRDLAGQCRVLIGRRSRTAAHGQKIAGGGGEDR